jgi:hypothetical protein
LQAEKLQVERKQAERQQAAGRKVAGRKVAGRKVAGRKAERQQAASRRQKAAGKERKKKFCHYNSRASTSKPEAGSQPETEGEPAPPAKRRFRPKASTEAPENSDKNTVLLQLAAEAFSERPGADVKRLFTVVIYYHSTVLSLLGVEKALR